MDTSITIYFNSVCEYQEWLFANKTSIIEDKGFANGSLYVVVAI